MFSGSKSFFRNPTGGGVATPSDASFSSVPLLLQTTSAVTGKSTTVSDAATPSYAFTASGSPTFGLTSPYQPDGYWSNYFGGTSDYLSLTGNAGFNFSTNDFTVECWAYFNDLSDYRTLIGNYTAPIATGNGQWLFQHIITTNKMGFYYDNGTVITGTTTLTTGIWYHFAMVRSGSTITAYVNGVSQGTATFSGTVGSSSATLNIGAPQNISTARMNGYISNVRIVKGTAVYTGAFTPSTTPLTAIANTSLLTCQSNRFIDNSTNKFTITPSGTPSISAETPVQPDGYWSNQFNGSTDYVGPANNAAFQFGSNNFTIEYWFNQISRLPSGYDATFILTGSMYFTMGNGSYGYALVVSGGSNLVLGSPVGSNLLPSLNTWHHMAIVRNGSTFTVYLNGVSLGTTTFAGALANPTGGFQVGWAGTFDSYFNGYISNFRAVKGTAVYTSNFTPPTAPLTAIANTVLLTCQSSSFKDNSTNNFTITRNGSPVTKSVVQPFTSSITSNGAALFNGSSSYLTTITTPITTTTSTFTVEAWIYSTVSGSSFPIIGDQNSAGSQVNWGFYVSSSNLLGLYWWNNSTNFATGNTTIKSNEWTHVALSISSNAISMYVNGVQQTISGATTFSNRVSTLSSLLIGQLSGYISNLRIVNGVTVYTGAFTPPSNFLTTTGGTYPSTSNVNTSIASTNTSLLANLNNGTYSGSSTLNTVTRNGTPTTGWISPYQTDGYWGNYLNGSSYLQFSASTAFAPGTGDFTVESWVYVITHNVAQGNWLYSQSASGHNYFVITFGPSGAGFTAASSGAGTGIGNSTTINTNTWYHIAVTRSSGIVRVFVNGVSGTPTSNTTDFTNVSYVPTIGSYSHAVYGLWNGYISNFRYVKGVAVYTGNFTPPSNFLTTTGGTYPITSNVNTSIASTNTSLLANLNNGTYSGSSTLNTVTRNGTPTTGWISPYQTDGYWSNYFGTTTSDNIYAASNAAFTVGTSNFTVEFWANWTAWSGEQRMILMGQSGSSAIEIGRGAGANALNIYTNTSSKISYTWTPTLNTWYHIAVVRSGTGTNQLTLYINGTNVGTGTSADSIAANNFFVGGLNWATGYNMQGYISNVRFVNGTSVYTGNFTPSTTPLTAIANTVLLTCQSNRFKDNSITSATITVNGTPQITPYFYPSTFTAPAASLGAGYFSGNGDYLTIPNNPALRPGTSDFTLECWVYWSGTNSGNATIFNILGSAWSGYSQTGQWIFYIDPTGGVVRFQVWNSVGVAAATALAQNRWYHIAVTRSSNTFKLYLNGKLDATNTISLDASTTVWNFYIGAYYDPSGPTYYGYFPGYLSDLRLVLNTVVYTGDFTPPSGRLTQTGGTYPSTTNVNTSIPATNTRLLLNFTESNYISASTGVNNNTFIDDSNYAYTITRNGTPTQGSFTPYWPNGQWSNYFTTNNYINSTTNSNVFQFGSSAYTVEGWIYQTDRTARQYICGGLFSGAGFQIFIETSGFISGSIVGVADLSPATIAVLPNTWTHFALVRTSTSTNGAAYYINGALAGTITDSNNISGTASAVNVGTSASAGSVAFNGYISNFRVTNGRAVYSGAFTPSTVPLTATTGGTNPPTGTQCTLLTCQSNRFRDNSAQVTPSVFTPSGTPRVQAFQPFSPTASYTTALYGGSGFFNGSTDYVSAASNAAFTLGSSGNNFTIECWVYANGLQASNATILTTYSNFSTGYLNRWFLGFLASSSNSTLVWYNSAGTGSTVTSSFPLNSWVHVAVVRSAGTITIYVNGASLFTQTTNQDYTTQGALSAGFVAAGGYFNGYISNARLVNGTAVYTGAFTPPIAPLTAISNTNLLLNFTNAAIYDVSAQNDVTTVGDTQSSTTIFKWAPTSIKFDGTGDYLNLSTGSPQSLTFGTGNFTIEFWIYFTSNTGTQTLYDGRAGVGAYPLLYLNNGVITYYVGSSAVITSVQPSTGVWYFMSLRRSSGTTQFFINGVQSGGSYSDSTNYLAPPTSGARVGANYSADSFLFGYMQDLRISKTARPVTPIPTAAFPTR